MNEEFKYACITENFDKLQSLIDCGMDIREHFGKYCAVSGIEVIEYLYAKLCDYDYDGGEWEDSEDYLIYEICYEALVACCKSRNIDGVNFFKDKIFVYDDSLYEAAEKSNDEVIKKIIHDEFFKKKAF